ncbi:type VI secretion system protein TssA [Yersinia mollaretii]|uniref:ImpA N-terminal domain-containing protein n=1 Tax=Yersinia mollaretii (strain ATCC 43969 / DSM 18520 / CIP 103324 / CNY 7263 / WAIP 204) TaxID=349967 RepID=A0ABP2EKZ8_YERMW|nr:type VI secretion system protein TssA [Yersinia mollaretii]EEQ11740.1 hypothetical protein ymoll0001_34990 [Yersinia mollaretii ATCC 43969]MDN0111378.1 type VI secretion system protein TssA [Yersinia mollaretii]PJE88289.1 type VI secretion system protein TssA [Yersinia mollaretii]QKJ01990.1 type VI secretion system protein TssA [Yersinia mollaretii ATCC 43969]CQD41589.1 Uncharacterized protein conserved in bacteria [Yersinia mollaretii]
MLEIKLDLDALLAPISTHSPAGNNMEYEMAYDEIRQSRESDPDYLPQDEWASTPRKADWLKVIRLSEALLSRQSKDFQVACWLTEALTRQYGTDGLLTGLRFLNQFIQRYWHSGWPALDDDGERIRQGKMDWLDRQLSQILTQLPLLGQTESSAEYWQKVLAFEHQVAMDSEQRNVLLQSGDYSMESFNRWALTVPSMQLSDVMDVLGHCLIELIKLTQCYVDLQTHTDSQPFNTTYQTIDELDEFLKRIGDRIMPNYEEIMSLNVLNQGTEKPELSAEHLLSDAKKQEMSRDLAISQMLTIAHFFRQSEPSSPVPFLMERAARWAGMTLTEWLEEMLRDDSSLQEINKILKGPGLP